MKQPYLGQKIAELRKSKGLTQENLVERSKISVRTIQRIENGEANPRNYTIEKILSALESDKEVLLQDEVPKINYTRLLKLSWISGIIYLMLGFIEGPMDFTRIVKEADDMGILDSSFIPILEYSKNTYLIVKILVALTFIFFMRGFIFIGIKDNKSIMQIITKILICTMILILVYDVISLYNETLNSIIVQIGISVVFGILSVIFGIALIQIRTSLGLICIMAGSFEIFAGVFFLFSNPIGFPIQMIAGLIEVFILYKVEQSFKNKTNLAFK